MERIDAAAGDAGRTRCECKVGRLAREYDIDGLDAELRHRWLGSGTAEQSTRELADFLNHEILRREMQRAGMHALDGEIENIFRLLTDDEVSKGMSTQARNTLEHEGVDPEALREAFVSHQTVYRHLRNCVGVTKSTEGPSPEEELERVDRLRSRSEAVVGDTLSRLRAAGHLTDDFEVVVNFRVLCERCGAVNDVSEVVAHGGCSCRDDSTGTE
ncbi:MAG: rod-determining factor RdfA [Salinigranum sp.]